MTHHCKAMTLKLQTEFGHERLIVLNSGPWVSGWGWEQAAARLYRKADLLGCAVNGQGVYQVEDAGEQTPRQTEKQNDTLRNRSRSPLRSDVKEGSCFSIQDSPLLPEFSSGLWAQRLLCLHPPGVLCLLWVFAQDLPSQPRRFMFRIGFRHQECY